MCFRPLTGCELFHAENRTAGYDVQRFRPLTGCKLFLGVAETNPHYDEFSSPGGA